ncbi:MAG: VOC family protein, partial [Sphingomonadaceae bacterium]
MGLSASEAPILNKGRIAQVAVITRDFEKTVHDWAKLLGAGPFFCGEFVNRDYYYRGRQENCAVDVAFGYLHDMQIQVVAQKCDTPSIYSEVLDLSPSTPMFHHTLYLTDDIDTEIARYAEEGVEVAALFEPKGMKVAFMDTIPRLGVMVEFFQMSPYFDDFFTRAHRA